MLQQTPVARVLPVYREWLAQWPTPQACAQATRADVLRLWGRLGYPRRALRLHETARYIAEHYEGRVPREVDQLLALPGVGNYTARAVSCFAYGERHPVVDTNVRRVLARAVVGQAEPWNPSFRRDREHMEAQLPEDAVQARVVSAGMMELGALVCTARAPRCVDCPISSQCRWFQLGRPADAVTVRRPAPKFEGSDRHVRGIILARLRESPSPIDTASLSVLWPDQVQLSRALAGLQNDGLIHLHDDRVGLPHE